MINSVIFKTSALAGRNLLATQRRTVISTPPLRRMPFAQKLVIGGTMIASAFFIVPGYILVNLKYYNGSAYKTKEEE